MKKKDFFNLLLGFTITVFLLKILVQTWETVWLLLFSVLLHEGGHIVLLKMCGKRVKLHFRVVFAYVEYDGDLDEDDMLWVALAGPYMTLMIVVLASLLYMSGLERHYSQILVEMNFILLIFNLLPFIPFFDGWKINHCLTYDLWFRLMDFWESFSIKVSDRAHNFYSILLGSVVYTFLYFVLVKLLTFVFVHQVPTMFSG